MQGVFKHVGAIVVGAVIPPAAFFIMTGFNQRVTAVVPNPTPTVTETPPPTPTASPTPTTTPTSTPNQTPALAPTQTPTPTTPPVTSGELDNWFTKYSNEFSVDRQKLWNIAVCESGLNPNAKNGDYGGLYQFASGTWASTRKLMSADTNADLRFSAEEAIKSAAFRISTLGAAAWPNCNYN